MTSAHQLAPFLLGKLFLSVPTTGGKEIGSSNPVRVPTNMEITNGKKTNTKVVNTNRLQNLNVPSPSDGSDPSMDVTNEQWNAPTVDHVYVPPPLPMVPRCYPLRQRHAPDRWGF